MVSSVVGAFLVALTSPAAAPCHVGSFVGAPYRVGERAGKVIITYSNGAGAQPGGTVDYRTVQGTAKAPADYGHASGTLRWGTAGGAASASGINPAYRTFEVPIRQDALDESSETFRVVMSHFTGCFDAATSEKTATVTIVDDDRAAPKPTQTSPSPSPQTTPAETPSAGATATSTAPHPSPSITAAPSPTQTFAPVAGSESSVDGGLSGGALAGIVGGVIVLGGGAAILVRRRFLS